MGQESKGKRKQRRARIAKDRQRTYGIGKEAQNKRRMARKEMAQAITKSVTGPLIIKPLSEIIEL